MFLVIVILFVLSYDKLTFVSTIVTMCEFTFILFNFISLLAHANMHFVLWAVMMPLLQLSFLVDKNQWATDL